MINMRHCVRGAGVHNGGGREMGCPISSELSPPMNPGKQYFAVSMPLLLLSLTLGDIYRCRRVEVINLWNFGFCRYSLNFLAIYH